MASFNKLKNGWQFRISYYVGGKRYTKSKNGYKSKKEAQLAASELERLLHQGNSLNAGEAVFIDYFKVWYETFRKGKLSWQNDRDIEISIRTAERFFKDVKIKDIDRVMYQQFLNDYGKDHATATVRKVHTYTRACLRDALNDGVIYKDPTYQVKAIGQLKGKDEELKFLNESEVFKLVKEIKSNLNPRYPSRYMILFGLGTGCRFSEVLGLTWDCVDFENNTITINKTWDYQEKHDFDKTKNDGSRRTIFVDKETLGFLYQLQIQQKKRQFKTGLRNKNNLVFIDDRMEPNSNNAVNKTLRRICKNAGITSVTFHALRHTHASMLLYQNVNIKYVSRRLGHIEITTTLQTYGHVLDEMEQRESSHVNQLMSKIYG